MIIKVWKYFTTSTPSFYKYILILFCLSICSLNGWSINNIRYEVTFIWKDKAFRTAALENVYLVRETKKSNLASDTIFPSYFKPIASDTLKFNYKGDISRHYRLVFKYPHMVKLSNSFLLNPIEDYSVREMDDTLMVELNKKVFDKLNISARILYSFLIKLIIEVLLAFPVALLLKLPVRLYFFVFVANIMSFPILYIPYLSSEVQEIICFLLEGVFIFFIGWKRLQFPKAMLVSLLLNFMRYGIAKVVLLFVRLY